MQLQASQAWQCGWGALCQCVVLLLWLLARCDGHKLRQGQAGEMSQSSTGQLKVVGDAAIAPICAVILTTTCWGWLHLQAAEVAAVLPQARKLGTAESAPPLTARLTLCVAAAAAVAQALHTNAQLDRRWLWGTSCRILASRAPGSCAAAAVEGCGVMAACSTRGKP